MNDILDHLSRDTLPAALLRNFISWCVWQQARPSLVLILKRVGLEQEVTQLQYAEDYHALASTSQTIAQHINEIRRQTGPLGLSTAEASAFLMQRLATVAMQDEEDAEGVSFFTAQLVGWSGFADSHFTDVRKKTNTELDARDKQAKQLEIMWRNYSNSHSDA